MFKSRWGQPNSNPVGFATSSKGSLKNQFIEQANGVGLVVADGFVVVTENTVGVVAVGGKAVHEGFGEGG